MADGTRTPGNGSVAGPGHYIVGEFLSAYEGDAYEDSRGQTKIPLNVKVLVGDEAITVRYNDASRGHGLVDGAVRGQLITLRVYHRLIIPKDNPTRAFVKVEGFVARSSAPAA